MKGQRCVWVERLEKGKGVGEHALFGLSSDAGSAFLRHTNTPSSSVHLPHSGGQTAQKSEREGDFVWDFPSFLFSQPPAFSVFPRKSGALLSNWQRIILPATPQRHTVFVFH